MNKKTNNGKQLFQRMRKSNPYKKDKNTYIQDVMNLSYKLNIGAVILNFIKISYQFLFKTLHVTFYFYPYIFYSFLF